MVTRPQRFQMAFAVWLCVVAVALSAEVAVGEQVANLAEDGKLYGGIPKEDLPRLTQSGIRNMDLWGNANADVIHTNNKLLKRLSTPWNTKTGKDCCKYHRIPWFKLGFMGKSYKDKSKSDCQALCNKYVGCKSFSYNFEAKECIWAPQSVTYDQDWRFYSKKTSLAGQPDGTYHMFPGMKFLEPTTEVEDNKSLQECMYSCTQELGCNSFSYSEPNAQCARSGQAIGYSEKWQYFEKDISSRKKPAWLEKHDKENELKDKLKKDYMSDIDRVRSKEKKDRAVERKRKLDIEVQVKKDGREAEEASKHAKIVEDKSEKDKKTADKVKSSNMQFEMRMEVTTSQIDELEKGSLEKVNKKLVDEKDSAAIAQLKADKKQVLKKIDSLKQAYEKEKQKENGEKDQFREKDMKANKGAEKSMKEEQKKRQEKFKEQMDKEEAKLMRQEKKSKDCGKIQKDAKANLAEAVNAEKASKTKMANEEAMVAKWDRKAKMATNEVNKKKYDEFLSESKESLDKATATEQGDIKKQMDTQRAETHVKEKCNKKAKKKADEEKKIAKQKKEMEGKKSALEEREKRGIKEGDLKMKESDVKESHNKEHSMKAEHMATKKERNDKENHMKEQTLKVEKKKIEVKEKETDTKELKHKAMVRAAEKKELTIKESTKKTKEKEELEFKEKYFKESKAKESAAKDSAHMTKEMNDKERAKANDREQEAAADESEANKKVLESKDEKESKFTTERLSKTEEVTIKAKMRRPRLQMVRRNDAGVIKVPAPGGTIMVGGGIINHYRKWNGRSIFEESYPDGDTWRCDTGVGNEGQATCISLSYKLPEGTKCVNARVYTANAGVIHATLPPGYLMVSGGVQNLHRRFDRHSAFEESMPAGDRKWRCDMGYGRGELNCFVRGCKFPHGAHCVTTEGSSDKAGWTWAECPEGYQVYGCGMRNNYLHFDPKSGFEDLRPVGNKCLGDMGFGPGRVSVYARCCKVNGPPPEIPAPAPSPKPGKVNPDNERCLGNKRYETRANMQCTGGDLEAITLKIKKGSKSSLDEQRSICASKCAKKYACTGFAFPTQEAVDASDTRLTCKLKNSMDHVYSEEEAKFCDTEEPSNDWDMYAKLQGSCKGKEVSKEGVEMADRRRRVDTSRRRSARLGEAKDVPSAREVQILGNAKQ